MFTDRYRFLSSSLISLIDNSQKTLKVSKEENVDNDEILNIVKWTKINF